jgi:hypothetical protein
MQPAEACSLNAGRFKKRRMSFRLRPAERSGDGAFEWTRMRLDTKVFRACESGVALRLPPQSKTLAGCYGPLGDAKLFHLCDYEHFYCFNLWNQYLKAATDVQ